MTHTVTIQWTINATTHGRDLASYQTSSKYSRSNVNKHELVYDESSSNAPEMPDVCLSFVLLFTIFIIVVTQKLVLQQSKNVTAKCTETIILLGSNNNNNNVLKDHSQQFQPIYCYLYLFVLIFFFTVAH